MLSFLVTAGMAVGAAAGWVSDDADTREPEPVDAGVGRPPLAAAWVPEPQPAWVCLRSV